MTGRRTKYNKKRDSWKPQNPLKRKKRGNYTGSWDTWREKSSQVMKRDGYTCRRCNRHVSELGPDERLECHHMRALSRGGTDDDSNLETLCSTCHARQPGHSHLREGRTKRRRRKTW